MCAGLSVCVKMYTRTKYDNIVKKKKEFPSEKESFLITVMSSIWVTHAGVTVKAGGMWKYSLLRTSSLILPDYRL